MTNKKSQNQRTSKRNPRALIWLDDHVVSSLGHKRNEKEIDVSKNVSVNNSTEKTSVVEKLSVSDREGSNKKDSVQDTNGEMDKSLDTGSQVNMNQVADSNKEKGSSDKCDVDINQSANDKNLTDEAQKDVRKSYASATYDNKLDMSRKLFAVPTEVDENGYEYVVVGYARVMVEVSAKKILPDVVEMVYRNRNGGEICRKNVNVKYDWTPPRCSNCCVYGHSDQVCKQCVSNEVQTEEKYANKECSGKESNAEDEQRNNGKQKDGFEEVRYKKTNGGGNKGQGHAKNVSNQTQKRGDGNQQVKQSQYVYQKKVNNEQGEPSNKNTNNMEAAKKGLSTTDKQNEVMKYIEDEKLNVCGIIETQLKTKKIQKIGDHIFKNWSWVHNMRRFLHKLPLMGCFLATVSTVTELHWRGYGIEDPATLFSVLYAVSLKQISVRSIICCKTIGMSIV
ncbi:hypothetical protein CTI12_AA142600 [Artemisia annua]|uniref:Zinc knuckle CX2CX4HX4C n=1 Tax=Artemisia annua TaxID=35608 RepID=A0A2U1PK87_ARTAN|nr:hypothetical protein CTI12_AA142600 [Artemisia annua]